MKSAKTCFLAILFFLMSAGISNAQLLGKIVLFNNYSQISFAVKKGCVQGIIPLKECIHANEIESVIVNSDRVGYGSESVATGCFNAKKKNAIVTNTSNSDVVVWSVVLFDGTSHFLNRDGFKIIYDKKTMPLPAKTIKRINGGPKDGFVQYGNFGKETVSFGIYEQSGPTALVMFANSLITKVVVNNKLAFGIKPEEIVRVQWNSDKVGWFSNSNRFSSLSVDKNGNLFAVIGNMPMSDHGFFSLMLTDGNVAWLNSDGWIFQGAGAKINPDEGSQVEYSFE